MLTTDMVAETTAGVVSDILTTGTYRKYATDMQGQLIIFGAILRAMPDVDHPTGISVSVPGYDLTTGALDFNMHTPAQVQTLLITLVDFYESQVNKLQGKIMQIYTANNSDPLVILDMIASVTW